MPTLHVNGNKLYYEQHVEGAPVLCIHGTSSSALDWEHAEFVDRFVVRSSLGGSLIEGRKDGAARALT
jgi:pimeloyl-ACP methyl ester carboxylesterase